MNHILAIDQGTTSSRVIVYDDNANPVFTAQKEFAQYYPGDGWVEHDANEIWASVLSCLKQALAFSSDIAAIGITNQRETTVVWDRETGKPVYNAIVWQDRRTADLCEQLKSEGREPNIQDKTGLLLDPYFSASKIKWILDNMDGARARAENGKLAFGTIDTWLIWKLTGGKSHFTDATNASRTMLYDISANDWDNDLCSLFDVPISLLPEVKNCVDDFGVCDKSLIGASIPIKGVAGDQQAAAIGQGCFENGNIKSTYGTGCFMLLNTGDKKLISKNRLLSTIAYRLEGQTTYALEGSIFMAGAIIQWLRDGLGVIKTAAETEEMARSLISNDGVYLVPAFTGLGAPHWRADARAALSGMTRDTGKAHLARASLEAICYQSHDLLAAMRGDGADISSLKVDGGLATNNWAMQFLADILDTEVIRPTNMETTALGVALLAGQGCGLYGNPDEFKAKTSKKFHPTMQENEREKLLTGWKQALDRVLA